jgi:hypothetical protein
MLYAETETEPTPLSGDIQPLLDGFLREIGYIE